MKEVLVTKGLAIKKARIMARGRTGLGYNRSTHIRIVLEKINFNDFISKQKNKSQQLKWIKREKLVEKIKLTNSTSNLDVSNISN